MCGRFSFFTGLEEIKNLFNIVKVNIADHKSYNIAPTQDVLVVVNYGEGNWLEMMRWGLIPVWAKDHTIGNKMINARSETIAEKPSFKRPLAKQRCVILADGFFEWRTTDAGKVPMFIHLKSKKPMAFAGLYDRWKDKEGKTITTCTIITCEANDFMKQVHHRMPIIFGEEQWKVWLDPKVQGPDVLLPLLSQFPSDEMAAYNVSREVNSPRNNSPELIQPS